MVGRFEILAKKEKNNTRVRKRASSIGSSVNSWAGYSIYTTETQSRQCKLQRRVPERTAGHAIIDRFGHGFFYNLGQQVTSLSVLR